MKKFILTLGIITLFVGCDSKQKEVVHENLSYTSIEKTITSKTLEDEGYILMKNNCYVCHNPNATSHDEIIAPPFKAVKMHYDRKYSTKDAYVDAIVDWVLNPTEEKSLMKGAVNKFKLMPKLVLKKSDLEKIATYIYENDVEEPEWMDDHMKEMHGNGKGNGNGKGKGNGGGKGMKHN